MSEKKEIEILLKLNDQMGVQLSAQTKNMLEASRAAEKLTSSVKEEARAQKEAGISTEKNTTALGGQIGQLVAMASAYISLRAVMDAYVQAGKFVLDVGGQFSQSMANTRAILQPTAAEFQALSLSARELGATTKFTAAQAADAYTELGKVGFTTSQILASGDAVLQLAAATNLELAESATIASATIKQFGLEAGDTQEVVDIMTKALSVSALDAKDYGDAMSYAGLGAKTAGMSVGETSAALGVLADNMIKGERAGTSFRQIIARLSDSSSDASKAVASINPNATTLIEKLEAIKKRGFDSTQAVKLFGLEAYTASLALVNGTEQIRKYGEELEWSEGKAKGFAKSVADIQMDTFSGDVQIARSAMENLGIALFDTFGPVARDAIQDITIEFGRISEWIDENPTKLKAWGQTAKNVFDAAMIAANALAVVVVGLNDALASVAGSGNVASSPEDRFAQVADQVNEAKLRADELKASLKDGFGYARKDSGMYKAYEEELKKVRELSFERDKLFNNMLEYQRALTADTGRSTEDQKTLDRLNEMIPAAALAISQNKSYTASVKELGKAEMERLKAQAQGQKLASGVAETETVKGPVEEVKRDKEKLAAQKKADENFLKLSREKEMEQLTQWQREIKERDNYWDDLIAADIAGGGRYLDQLKAMRQVEIDNMLKVGPADAEGRIVRTFSGRGMVTEPTTSTGATGMGAGQEASDAVRQQRQEEEINARRAQAQAINAELQQSAKSQLQIDQETYEARKRILEEFNLSTEQLTAEHETRQAETQRAIWETRLYAAGQFFGGFAKLAAAASVENKKYANIAKTLAYAEAGINTALAVTKAMSQTGILGIAAAIGVGATGAAQMLTIKQTKFAKGQYSSDASFGDVPGTSYSGDKVLAGLNSGERVLTAAENREYKRGNKGSITMNFNPTYNTEISDRDRRRSYLEFQRMAKSVIDDPTFETMQGAL